VLTNFAERTDSANTLEDLHDSARSSPLFNGAGCADQ